jgi:hypothetical protein
MVDHHAIARRNVLIAAAAIILTAVGYFYVLQPWLARQDNDRKEAAARKVEYQATLECVAARGFSLNSFFHEDIHLIQVATNCEIHLLKLSHGTDAQYEAETAKCDYDSNQARIAHTSRLCDQWALCSKGEPYKAAFNICYSVFGPTKDDAPSSAHRPR